MTKPQLPPDRVIDSADTTRKMVRAIAAELGGVPGEIRMAAKKSRYFFRYIFGGIL